MADNDISVALSEFSTEATETINRIIEEEAKAAADELKQTSPKKTGRYRKSWSVQKKRTEGRLVATIHNKKRGGLTHLLEKPHRKVSPAGKFKGMTKGQPHIKPAEDKVTRQVEQRIKSEIGGN